MTKRQLCRYVRLVRELKLIDFQLSNPQMVTDRVQASSALHPYLPYHAMVTGVDPQRVLRFRRRRARIIRQLDEIKRFVEGITDTYARDIIRARYIYGRSWVQIGGVVNTPSDCVRMSANRYLDSVCKP